MHLIINMHTYRVPYICPHSNLFGNCISHDDCCPRSKSRHFRKGSDCMCPKVRLRDYLRRDRTADRMTNESEKVIMFSSIFILVSLFLRIILSLVDTSQLDPV